EQAADERQRSECQELAVGEVELVADVRRQDAEARLVELVHAVQTDEHDQRQQGLAAAHLAEEPPRPSRHVRGHAEEGEQDLAGFAGGNGHGQSRIWARSWASVVASANAPTRSSSGSGATTRVSARRLGTRML